ncbi:MAG: Gfo/Idh/MocA family protein [Cytophaga sp.]|uniref:Gfo/Idh/MocA family protein n=1 Tax=Cytophaga sp. TaxID=29535 RepID=UPI003F81FACC
MLHSILDTLELPVERRHFLFRSTQTLLSAALIASMAGYETNASELLNPQNTSAAGPVDKISLPPLEAQTEQKKGPLPNPEPMEKRIGYAIVGLGHLALEQVLPSFGACEKSKITALVSGNRDKALTVAKQYGVSEKSIYDYQNFDSIKNNPDVDVVYIILPNCMHAEFTIRSAKAGKHVLCEKPMANTVAECEQMIKACEDAKRKLMIAYRIQYEPNNTEIKKMVREETYGKVKSIVAVNGQNIGDPSQWRLNKKLAGGGSLPDVGIYCLNTIRFLIGEEPVEVYAQITTDTADPRFKEVEDVVNFQLTFPGGLRAMCGTSYSHHQSRNYRVYAERAFFGMDPAFAYGGLQMHRSFAQDESEIYETPKRTAKNQFALEIDHMSDCVRTDKKPFTPGEEGLQDMKIIEALYLSARENRPVQLKKYEGKDLFRGSTPEK